MQIKLYSRDSLTGEPKNIDGVVFRSFWEGTENDFPFNIDEFVDAEEAVFVFAADELQIGDVVKIDDRHYVKTHGQWVEVNKYGSRSQMEEQNDDYRARVLSVLKTYRRFATYEFKSHYHVQIGS